MKIQTFKKLYKNNKFIGMCELFIPAAMMPATALVEILGGGIMANSTFIWAGATFMSLMLASAFFSIKETYSPFSHFGGSKFNGYLAHYLDSLFISKNKEIFHRVIKSLIVINSQQSIPLGDKELKEATLFTLMKIMTACGIDKKETWAMFYSLNKDNMDKYSNFFIDDEKNVEKNICAKMQQIPTELLQAMFDLSIKEIGEDMGTRFHLIHQHHTLDFHNVIKKIHLHFSPEDRQVAQDFVERAKKDELNSNQYLSYGTILNDDLIQSLISQNDIPDEILDYLIYCNDNISLDNSLIEKINQIKQARIERDILSNAIAEVKSLSLKQNGKNNSEVPELWGSDRLLELPKNAGTFKI